jgi:hypothetical protein
MVVLTWVGIGLAVLIVGPVEDLAARRRPQLIPGASSRRGQSKVPVATG